MIERKRRLLRAAVVWLIKTSVGLLRLSTTRKAQQPAEESQASAKLKPLAVATLQQALNQGHTSIPLIHLARFLCSRHKGFAAPDVHLALRRLSQQGGISIRGSVVSLPHVAQAEETIADSVGRIGRRSRKIKQRHLADWVSNQGDQLNEEQRDALRILTTSPLAILTGAPGTGKTLLIKAAVSIFEQNRHRVYLAAPTGRAAARLSEATDRPAQTLHRLLYNHDRQRTLQELNPSTKEVIIIDEASMLDVFLFEQLVKFCTSRTRLILVGDIDQLPPVGPGQVFRDLIESNQIPVVKLTRLFRQSEDSLITTAARKIKAGIAPELPAPGDVQADCYFIEADSPAEIRRLVATAATSSLPKRRGADPYLDIQVLTPMSKGPLGTLVLNKLIRQSLNPRHAPTTASPQPSNPDLQPGDRVIQTRNNYDLGVFNGECGVIEEVTGKSVTVRIGRRRLEYTLAQSTELIHAFAITIHRAQGSEYPFVVIPVHESQSIMLTRELLYTALTRGRKMVALIGSRRALMQAISASRSKRRTGLKDLLSPRGSGG